MRTSAASVTREAMMSLEIRKYLAKMPHFAMLPEQELDRLAGSAQTQNLSKGTRLAVKGQTNITHIYIIKRGQFSLYDEVQGRSQLGGYIKVGEVFGGITLLMNGGISLRTVQVDEDTHAYMIPKADFLDLCTRYKDFYAYFVENFSKHIIDPALDTIIASSQAKIFLAGVAPFSFLPEEVIDQSAEKLSLISYPQGTVLFVQSRTRVGHLYILQQGAAERYFEKDGEKTMHDMLGAGDLYGGISMLLNDGLAVRTLEVTKDSFFYLLPKKEFSKLCEQHEGFSEFFTDTFGKRMLDRSYAAIVARSAAPPEEELQLFNQPVHQICSRATVFGTPDMSIRQVARRMEQENSTYLMIPASDLQEAGIITESDLTRKVIATGYDINRPAVEVMSCPLHAVGEQAMVIEALMAMMQCGIKHLAVTNAQNDIIGVLSNRELISAQGQTPLFLLREISRADSIEEIIEQHQRLPGIVKGLISSGATARNISRMITTVSDAILQKVMQFVLQEMPPPPTDFVFMVLGSEGRGEQTLKTDQDNAIIFEDVSEAELPDVSAYFMKFGQKACTLLDKAGYAFCEGDVMAQNPQWCQPLSIWMRYFLKWIHAAEPEDLLQASIFFDFRGGYGDMQLVESLRDHLHGAIRSWTGFLRHMTENAMYFKPPLGFFGNFVVESKGKHRDKFDIKSAMMPIVDFARVYAIKNGISATNTFDRLFELCEKGVLSQQEFEELEKAYSFLMQLRFTRQVTAFTDQKAAPDNFINPKRLTRIEQTTLKEIFKRVEKFQAKMGFDFIGMA
jgi:CBS domain-containing protein